MLRCVLTWVLLIFLGFSSTKSETIEKTFFAEAKRYQVNGLMLQNLLCSGPARAAKQISVNGHHRTSLFCDSGMEHLSMNRNAQTIHPAKPIIALIIGEVQIYTQGSGLIGKQNHISGGVQGGFVGQIPEKVEISLHRKRETAFVGDREGNKEHFCFLIEAGVPVLYQDPLSHGSRLKGYLAFDGKERAQGREHAADTDKKEERGGGGCNASPSEHPSIESTMVLFLCFGFGGLLLCFLPLYWCLLVSRSVNYQGALFGASFLGALISSGSIVWFFLSGVFPYTWGLPPGWVPKHWQECQDTYRQGFPHGLNVSQKLLTPNLFLYYTKSMANVLSTDRQIAIIGSLAEGSSIRSIERITGVHRDTIMRLGVRVGKGCTALLDAKMRNLDCQRLEMDELWGFVGKKERHVRPGDDPQFGNVWTYCAIDADSKLVPAFRVSGDRELATTTAFVMDVADRMKNRVQISTDGLKAYVDAIDWAFGGKGVDYAQIIKTYGVEESVEAQRRYSAPKISGIEKKAIFGRPNFDLISTSYVERLNATTRLHMKRLTRLTHAFSKKRENFEAAVGLHFAYYNFVRRHNTLRCTPAMAAGVEQSFWTVADLVEATA
jgi:IS1 family transposase